MGEYQNRYCSDVRKSQKRWVDSIEQQGDTQNKELEDDRPLEEDH